MRQNAVLIRKAQEFKEPVLLVGDTGGGKTTICKILAEMNNQQLVTVNCHMHTESGDFIGGLHPVRDHSVCIILITKDAFLSCYMKLSYNFFVLSAFISLLLTYIFVYIL